MENIALSQTFSSKSPFNGTNIENAQIMLTTLLLSIMGITHGYLTSLISIPLECHSCLYLNGTSLTTDLNAKYVRRHPLKV